MGIGVGGRKNMEFYKTILFFNFNTHSFNTSNLQYSSSITSYMTSKQLDL